MNYCARGHFIPDNNFDCPKCVEAKNDQALRDQQPEYLRKAARGEFAYALRVTIGLDRHVLMYSIYPTVIRAFCGVDWKSKPKLTYESLNEATLANVCALCRAVLRDALEEAAL